MFGAPKKCAKCDKQVYPIEELKCLDKIWHKNCFKCSVCNSLLNMKNYKGFDKQPYCVVHYPQQKPTVVSDNPELLRIKENTKIQSNAKYHEDFEKSKGSYTVVADDPETRRILENTKIISQVKYHEDFEKNIKNKYTPVLDNPETARAIENQKIVSSAEYKGIKNQNQIQNGNYNSSTIAYTNVNNGYYNGNVQPIVQTSKGPLIPTFKNGIEKQTFDTQSQRKIGSIADYDPLVYEGPLVNGNGAYQQQQYANGSGRTINRNVYSTGNLNSQQPKLNGSSTYNSTSNIINYANGNGHHVYQPQPQQAQTVYNNNGNHQIIGNYDIPINNDIKTTVYKAIYDYDAKEDDEISFRDGDKFINCEQIDVGWMIGVHEKTGKHGMFPANYAEPVDYF